MTFYQELQLSSVGSKQLINNEYYVLGEKVGNAFSDGKNLK